MPDDAKRTGARKAARDAQARFERDAESVREARRRAFANAQAAGLSLREIADEIAPGEYEACDYSDANGEYAIRSLPAGTYRVAYGREYLLFGVQVGQWWNGVSSAAEASLMTIAPPETRTGIDGFVVNPYPKPVTSYKPSLEGVAATFPQILRKPLARCHKRFHRKKVHGKSRCVRKHKRAHSHEHGAHRAAV